MRTGNLLNLTSLYLREAKVADLDNSLFIEENVSSCQVTVYNLSVTKGHSVQSLGNKRSQCTIFRKQKATVYNL